MNAAVDHSTKNKVMEAALRMFAERGYAAASVRDIAALAGVTKPVVYYHFGSKAGLYQALLDQCFTFPDEVAAAVDQAQGIREKLMQYVQKTLTLAQSNADAVRVVVQTYSGSPGQIPSEITFRDGLRTRYEWLRGIVQAGIDSGEIRSESADLLALSIMGQTHFLVTSMLVFGPDHQLKTLPPGKELAASIVDLLFTGANGGGHPTSGSAAGAA